MFQEAVDDEGGRSFDTELRKINIPEKWAKILGKFLVRIGFDFFFVHIVLCWDRGNVPVFPN